MRWWREDRSAGEVMARSGHRREVEEKGPRNPVIESQMQGITPLR